MARSFGERHHILHHGRQHEANKDNKWLRNNGLGMIALLEPDAHRALHIECPSVPPLDVWSAQRARSVFKGHHDPNLAIIDYMRSVEHAIRSPKSHHIERAVAQLVIHAVDLQRPFIREGLIIPEL